MSLRGNTGNPFRSRCGAAATLEQLHRSFHQPIREVPIPFAIADQVAETSIAPSAKRPAVLCPQLGSDAAELALECSTGGPLLPRLDRQRKVLQELRGLFRKSGGIVCAKPFPGAVRALAARRRLRIT